VRQVNLAEGATQCQATTVKGSQCRRKSNLIVVEKTVDELRYKRIHSLPRSQAPAWECLLSSSA